MASLNVASHPGDPLEHPGLHASKQKLHDVIKPSYWQQLCPSLHVSDKAFIGTMKSFQLPEARLDDLKQQINLAGVAQVASPELPWSVSPDILAHAIVTLMRYGWPPLLIIIYDEVWGMIEQARMLMNKATGGNACNMDILAWYVDPSKGDVGFSPHRDRQPEDSPATFRPDGTPMYATLWLALTDATPENSCLYVLPRFADPGYYAGDPDDEDAPDPLSTALNNKEAYQNIRALPAPKGSAAIFTHRTIHWGSKGRPGYPTPRISISWGCADDNFEPAYFSRDYLPCPPLEMRLALAGAQMIIYHERFPAPPKQLALYYQAFTAQADNFDSGYRSKVMKEFVDASKEATAAAAAAAVARPTSINGNAALAPRPAAAGIDESEGRTRSTRSRTKLTTAAAAAAANGTLDAPAAAAAAAAGARAGGGFRPVLKRRKCTTGAVSAAPAAAAAVAAENNGSRPKKKQKKGSEEGLKEAGVKGRAAEVQQSDKKRRRMQAGAAAAAAAAAPDQSPAAAAAVAAAESEEADDGIDWAAVTAAAQKLAVKEQRRRKKHRGSGKGTAASSSSSSSGDSAAYDDDSDGDVMDLALDSMLDAALAGEDNFQDDYNDE